MVYVLAKVFIPNLIYSLVHDLIISLIHILFLFSNNSNIISQLFCSYITVLVIYSVMQISTNILYIMYNIDSSSY